MFLTTSFLSSRRTRSPLWLVLLRPGRFGFLLATPWAKLRLVESLRHDKAEIHRRGYSSSWHAPRYRGRGAEAGGQICGSARPVCRATEQTDHKYAFAELRSLALCLGYPHVTFRLTQVLTTHGWFGACIYTGSDELVNTIIELASKCYQCERKKRIDQDSVQHSLT